MKTGVLLGCLALATAGSALASTVKHVPLPQMVRMAHTIVHGKVTDVRCAKTARGVITTTYTLQVEDAIKGVSGPKGQAFRFTVPGGTLDGVTLRIPGMPSLRPGEETIVFLGRPGTQGTCVPIGLPQGKFRVALDPVTRKRVVRRSFAGVRVVDPKTKQPVQVQTGDLPLEGFVKQVRDHMRRNR